jgi:hypothetical protein
MEPEEVVVLGEQQPPQAQQNAPDPILLRKRGVAPVDSATMRLLNMNTMDQFRMLHPLLPFILSFIGSSISYVYYRTSYHSICGGGAAPDTTWHGYVFDIVASFVAIFNTHCVDIRQHERMSGIAALGSLVTMIVFASVRSMYGKDRPFVMNADPIDQPAAAQAARNRRGAPRRR